MLFRSALLTLKINLSHGLHISAGRGKKGGGVGGFGGISALLKIANVDLQILSL